LDCENIPNGIDEIFLALAYPFLFECLVYYPSIFAMISIYWWEHMWDWWEQMRKARDQQGRKHSAA